MPPAPLPAPETSMHAFSIAEEAAFRQRARRALLDEAQETPAPGLPQPAPPQPQGPTPVLAPTPTLDTISAEILSSAVRLRQTDGALQDLLIIDARGLRNRKRLKIQGTLDLSHARVDIPINLVECEFDGINLDGAQLQSLSLSGGTLTWLTAFNIRTQSDLDLNDCKVEDYVFAMDARIGGSVFAENLTVSGEGGVADNRTMVLHRARVDASVILRGSNIKGRLDLVGATIGGQLDCESLQIKNVGALAIDAERLVARAVIGRKLHAEGWVCFSGANVSGYFDFNGATLEHASGTALDCDGVRVETEVHLGLSFRADGTVKFGRATIGGSFVCGGTFSCPDGVALDCDNVRVTGNVLMRDGFRSEGIVDFWGAVISGSFFCYDATLACDFVSDGDNPVAIRLRSAVIGGALFFVRSTEYAGAQKTANDEHADITGDVVLNGVRADEIVLPSERGLVDGFYRLDGFTYQRIKTSDGATRRALSAWLNRQPVADLERSFRAQPWTQLARVLRNTGYMDEARAIAIERERKRTRTLAFGPWLWSTFLAWTVLYGYSPWRPLAWSLAFVIASWLVFDSAGCLGYMAPHDTDVLVNEPWTSTHQTPGHYPPFNSFVYALDVYLPISGLGEKEAWYPTATRIDHKSGPDAARARCPESVFARLDFYASTPTDTWLEDRLKEGWHKIVMWSDTLLGWIFVSIFIAGITGIVKRED